MQQLKAIFPKSKKAALVFRALNNPFRQSILQYITAHPGCSVTNIYVGLRLEQSVASQHLAILRRVGIVKATRNGKFIYYSVVETRLQQIEQVADKLLAV